ncbi:site-specific integrase [Pseudomonas putida]|uniref:tyrosine-type recombinase/integrase n=1 Tax=Pseudomonas putida TaxID=303 RepID=UPI002363283B|nr:tyrosine-type recombinase/integrase [Pseudomonas putida]MDD2139515.1 site-specific integrase [Pseudomonas putida]HDS1721843.1 tyrosine-type recombinase/integrase [Pseudomonas putida]
MKTATTKPTKAALPSTDPAGEDDIKALARFYIEAGKSENTERTYKSHINHYRSEWGGLLPATKDKVIEYIAVYAKTLKVSTLRQRLSALSKWHKEQGFADPTAYGEVKQALKGIAKHHQGMTKQAYPLTFKHMLAICDRLEAEKRVAIEAWNSACSTEPDTSPVRRDAEAAILRTHRDLALILIGFWQAFRSDELSRITFENVRADRNQGMVIYLSHSKTDRDASGSSYELQAFKVYCPVSAYLDWQQVSGLTSGLVFRSINRWGKLAETGIHRQSIDHILNRVSRDLFPNEPKFSTHSLRRGFTDWAVREGWDMKMLMDHVGWLSMDSARKYMPVRKDFGALALNNQGGAIFDGVREPASGLTLLGHHNKTQGA